MHICVACHLKWPCPNPRHDGWWALRKQQPDDSTLSIPCFVLDHKYCQEPAFCTCPCHGIEWMTEPSISVPPSNR